MLNGAEDFAENLQVVRCFNCMEFAVCLARTNNRQETRGSAANMGEEAEGDGYGYGEDGDEGEGDGRRMGVDMEVTGGRACCI
jgi:hypothetical protein